MGKTLAAVCMTLGIVGAQTPAPQVFRSSADMVPVYVSVMGRDGRQIAGLKQDDFTLLDGGKKQPITFFSAERHPFAVAFVLDSTFSMQLGAGFARQVDTARAMVDALDREDQASLGSLARPLVELSADKLSLNRLLRQPPMQISQDSNTPGAERENEGGLQWAISALSLYEGRRIVVMFTDGQRQPRFAPIGDQATEYGDPAQLAVQLVRKAERADVAVHAIAFDDTMVEEQFLSAFASTGGGASLIAHDANLKSVAKEFVDELHHEYLIGFVPAQFDGKSHKIEVKVNRAGAKVRARRTYFAPKR